MGIRNHNPGCPCCGCEIHDYNFLNAAIADAPYTVTGDVELTLGAGWKFYGDGKAISDRERTTAKQAWVWTISEISATKPPDGCIVYFYLLYASASNYLAVKVTYLSGSRYKGELVECASAVETVIDNPTRDPTNWFIGLYEMNVCIDGNEVVVSGSDGLSERPVFWMRGDMASRSSLGGFHGIEIIGGDNTNTATGTLWESIEEVQLSADCIICQCTQCETLTAPKTVTATIARVFTQACADCPDYNAVFTLHDEKPTGDSIVTDQLRACTWTMQRTYGCVPNANGFEYITMYASNGVAAIEIGNSFTQQSAMWIGTPPVDCADMLDGLVIPLFGYVRTGGGTNQCLLGFAETITGSTVGNETTPGTITISGGYGAVMAAGDLITIQTGATWTYGQTEEFYTIASFTGTLTHTITLDRALPASRTGSIMRWHATATVAVVE